MGRRADQYRLVLLGEVLITFTDTDGDHIRIQRDGRVISLYVNGRLDVGNMGPNRYFHIDASARKYQDPGGRGFFTAEEDLPGLVRKRDLMFIDRDFVARCLMTVCSLPESGAYQVMMQALTEGLATVGTYTFETAEAYCEGLKARGLNA